MLSMLLTLSMLSPDDVKMKLLVWLVVDWLFLWLVVGWLYGWLVTCLFGCCLVFGWCLVGGLLFWLVVDGLFVWLVFDWRLAG